MKKLFITLCLCLLTTVFWSQNDKGAKIVPVSQAIQNKGYNIQIGLPFLGLKSNGANRLTNPVDVRFPWSVLYLYPTFTSKEGSFEVSKGYYGDKIL